MKHWKKYLLIFMIAAVGTGIVLSQIRSKGKRGPYQISCICREAFAEGKQPALRQGLEQAAADYNLEITTIIPDHMYDEKEQLRIIQGEAKNGADAILIEPLNSPRILEELEEISKNIPVIFMNSNIEGNEKIECIQCDYIQLGQKLAGAIELPDSLSEVILLRQEMEYEDAEKSYQGMTADFQAREIPIKMAELQQEHEAREMQIRELVKGQENDVMIASNPEDLEMLAKIKKETKMSENSYLYGIGTTNQIIAYIEEEMIQAVGVANEYSVGYLSVQAAFLKIKGENYQRKEIGWSIIHKDNLYTTENQRLLFPFVQ